VQLHALLTSALDGGEWSASHPGRFTPRERAPGTHWIGGWVDPRNGLDAVDITKRKFGKEMTTQTKIKIHYITSKATLKYGSEK